MAIAYNPRFINPQDLDKDLIPVKIPEGGQISMAIAHLPAHIEALHRSQREMLKRDLQTAFYAIDYGIFASEMVMGKTHLTRDVEMSKPPQNCRNCGAALYSSECEYCHTRYQ